MRGLTEHDANKKPRKKPLAKPILGDLTSFNIFIAQEAREGRVPGREPSQLRLTKLLCKTF